MNDHGYAKSTGCNIMQNMCPEVEVEAEVRAARELQGNTGVR